MYFSSGDSDDELECVRRRAMNKININYNVKPPAVDPAEILEPAESASGRLASKIQDMEIMRKLNAQEAQGQASGFVWEKVKSKVDQLRDSGTKGAVGDSAPPEVSGTAVAAAAGPQPRPQQQVSKAGNGRLKSPTGVLNELQEESGVAQEVAATGIDTPLKEADASNGQTSLAERCEDLEKLLAAVLSDAEMWKDNCEQCQKQLSQALQDNKHRGDDAGVDDEVDTTQQPKGDTDLVRAWKGAWEANKVLLLHACRMSDVALVKQAITAARYYDPWSYDDCTPLHFAAERGNLVIAKLLLSCKQTNINAKAKDGTTPLYRACEKVLIPMVKLLLSHGANLSIVAPGKGGNGPLHVASSSGDKDMVLALLNESKDETVVLGAAGQRNSAGDNPLHLACSNGHWAVAEALISKGADSEARDGSRKALTPLHRACISGHLRTVQLLVEKGVDTEAKTDAFLNKGKTALELARLSEHIHIVSFLQQHGTLHEQSTSTL